MKATSNIRIIAIGLIAAGFLLYNKSRGIFGVDEATTTAFIILFLGNSLFIISFFLNRKKKVKPDDTSQMICEKCKSKYKTKWVQVPVCPRCDGKLVAFDDKDNAP